jgi:ABC-2 type transport system permease protein
VRFARGSIEDAGPVTNILVKEFIQLWRDKWGRVRLIAPPLIQLLLFGYAATFEVHHVSTAVLDLDHSQESRELVARFTSSDHLRVVRIAQTQDEISRMIDRSDAAVALVIHAGFANTLRKGRETPLQVLVDGTNSNSALIALGYINTIASAFAQDYAADLMQRVGGVKAENNSSRSRSHSGPGTMRTSTVAGSSCRA